MEQHVRHSAPHATHHSSELPTRPELQSAFFGAGVAAITAAIYLGQPIFMRAALAVLLAFALAPVAERLRRLHLGQIPSVLLTVLFASSSSARWAPISAASSRMWPKTCRAIRPISPTRSNSIRGAAHGNGLIARASAMLDQLDNEFTGAVASASSHNTPKPTLVEIKQDDGGPLHIIQAIAGPLLAPLATATIVIIFVIFILLQKEDLRDRFIRLAGAHDLRRTTIALDDAASRLEPLPVAADHHQHLLRHRDRHGAVADWNPHAGLWGLIGDDVPLRALYRRAAGGDPAGCARCRRRSRLGESGVHGGALRRGRIDHGAGDRTGRLRP